QRNLNGMPCRWVGTILLSPRTDRTLGRPAAAGLRWRAWTSVKPVAAGPPSVGTASHGSKQAPVMTGRTAQNARRSAPFRRGRAGRDRRSPVLHPGDLIAAGAAAAHA